MYIVAILALMLALFIAMLKLPILYFYQNSEISSKHTTPRLSSKPKFHEMLILKSIDGQSTIHIIEDVALHCNHLGHHLHLDTSSVKNIWDGSNSFITKKCERIGWKEKGKCQLPGKPL